MRYRGIIASVLMMAMLLASCGQSTAETAQRIAQYYKNLDSWQSNVEMIVDLGEETAAFLLAWDVSSEESSITVLEPQEIAGLSVSVSSDGQALSYEGSVIALPKSDGGEAPMPTEALMLICDMWKNGIRKTTCEEQLGESSIVRIDYIGMGEDDSVEVTSRFDSVSMAPISAEVFYNGTRMITCTFESFASGQIQ